MICSQPIDQCFDEVSKLRKCFVGWCYVEVMDLPILDSILPRWELCSHQGSVFGFLHRDRQTRLFKVGRFERNWTSNRLNGDSEPFTLSNYILGKWSVIGRMK